MKLAGYAVILLAAALLMLREEPRVNQEHAKWIASVMDSIHTIKPGMTRQDLVKLFTTEGGAFNRRQRTYVYRECSYIKVAVKFQPIDDPQAFTEMSTDKIVSISDPFLQYNTVD
jgi:hypothetical protein